MEPGVSDEVIAAVAADRQNASVQAMDSLDDNPDDAAQAHRISKVTGIPSSVVYGDFDHYQAQTKAALTSQLINSNEFIRGFLNDHPLGAKVANDDYVNLDEWSDKLKPLATHGMMEAPGVGMVPTEGSSVLGAAAAGAKEGFDFDQLQQEHVELGNWLSQNPLFANVFVRSATQAAGDVLNLNLHAFNALITGAAAGAGEAAKQSGVSEAWADRLTRDVYAGLPLILSGQAGLHLHPAVAAEMEKFTGPVRAAEPWLRSGEAPPLGLSEETNKLILDEAKTQQKNLQDAQRSAQKSALRERAPDLAADFARQQLGDRQVTISADAVRALYGDKLPSADDGMLGWVEDLADQLDATEETGGRVSIPMADWLAHVTPELFEPLKDHIATRYDEPTVEEADELKELKFAKARPTPNDALDGVRQAANLEPLVERKLTLRRIENDDRGLIDIDGMAPEGPVHSFELLDPNGKTVGNLYIAEEFGGKRLYVDDIRGEAFVGAGVNSFGPAAMRDLLRQVKAEFPKAETLEGFRVSGARDKAGTWETKGKVKISLAKFQGDDELAEFFGQGPGESHEFAAGYRANFVPQESFLAKEQEAYEAVGKEMERLGVRTEVHAPVKMTAPRKQNLRGAYVTGEGFDPFILVALGGDDPVGALRHEHMHDLLNRFYDDSEKAILQRAAREEGWVKKFDIDNQYKELDTKGRLEEAITHAYERWEQSPETESRGGKLFQKFRDLLEAIRGALAKVFGHEPTWQELFRKSDEGEIAAREPKAGEGSDAGFKAAKQPDLPGTTRMEDRLPFEGRFPSWLTQPQRVKLDELIRERQKEDFDKAQARAEKFEKRKQTPEWRAKEDEVRSEVEAQVATRPDLAADAMFAEGRINGVKSPTPIRLDPKFLTDEQREALPKKYLAAGGHDPDDLVGLFGFPSGDSLVASVARVVAVRKQANMSAAEYRRRIVNQQTEEAMRVRYGDLSENIIDAARDSALSQSQVDLLHEWTLALATAAKAEFPITKDQMAASRAEKFGNFNVTRAREKYFLQDAGRQGRLMEGAYIKQDWAEAFRKSQVQYHNIMYAREARGLERQVRQFERIAKRFRERYPDNFPPEFTDAIQDLLMKLERPVRRSPEDLQREVAERGHGTVKEWVDRRNLEGQIDGSFIPYPDWMQQGKPFDTLSVNEFRDVKATLDALVKQGRDQRMVEVDGAKRDIAEWVKQAGEQLAQKFPLQHTQETPTRWYNVKTHAKDFLAAITNMETLYRRFDNRDPRGHFTKMFTYPAAEAANYKARLDREFSQVYKELRDLKDPDKLLDPPFVNPDNGLPFNRFTRKNLEAVVANIGNKDNLEKMAAGFGIKSEDLLAWVESVTTKEDLDRAQRRGDMFSQAKRMHDNVERNLNGYASPDIKLAPFEMHGKTYAGWYHPIIDDPDKSPYRGPLADMEKGPQTFWPTTATGFTKERQTGAKHVISLNMDMVPVKLNQMLHAIAFKEFVHNTAKLYKNDELRRAVRNYYGREYVEEQDQWLQDIAGNASYNTRLAGKVERISNFFRQNVIGTYIGFNPYTIQKHGLSAAAMSARQVGFAPLVKATAQIGADYLYHAVSDMFGKDPYLGDTLAKFVWENSEEIQRRARNWQETVVGQHDLSMGKAGLRQTIAQWASKGVGLSDMVSAGPMWLAAYRKAFADLGEHGPAVEQANSQVRLAHGSTAITNLPRAVRNAGALGSWLTSVYGFWGTMMQRRIELAQDMSDFYHLGKDGEIKDAAKMVPKLAADTFVYAIWPAMVEEWVTSQYTDDKRGLGTHIVMGLFGGLASSMLFLRDVYYGLGHGRAPSVGLLGGPAEDIKKFVEDLQSPQRFSKQRAGRLIQDTVTVFGEATGTTPKIVGSAARFGVDYYNRVQRPRTAGDVFRGVTRGNMQQRIEK